jgi:hypothetical protein
LYVMWKSLQVSILVLLFMKSSSFASPILAYIPYKESHA